MDDREWRRKKSEEFWKRLNEEESEPFKFWELMLYATAAVAGFLLASVVTHFVTKF